MDTEGSSAGGSWEQLPSALQKLAELGSSESDSEDLRLRKRVLNLSSALMATLSPIWVLTYSALGIWLAAAIPFVYILASAALIYAHSRSRIYRAFRTSQLAMMLRCPSACNGASAALRTAPSSRSGP